VYDSFDKEDKKPVVAAAVAAGDAADVAGSGNAESSPVADKQSESGDDVSKDAPHKYVVDDSVKEPPLDQAKPKPPVVTSAAVDGSTASSSSSAWWKWNRTTLIADDTASAAAPRPSTSSEGEALATHAQEDSLHGAATAAGLIGAVLVAAGLVSIAVMMVMDRMRKKAAETQLAQINPFFAGKSRLSGKRFSTDESMSGSVVE
jgi:hypothetical protein